MALLLKDTFEREKCVFYSITSTYKNRHEKIINVDYILGKCVATDQPHRNLSDRLSDLFYLSSDILREHGHYFVPDLGGFSF